MRIKKAELKTFVLAVVIVSGILIASKALSQKIMFQITPSLPKGVYWIDNPVHIDTGMLCVFSIPRNVYGMMKSRGWIPENLKFYLMKPIVAKQGDEVEVSTTGFFVNGKYLGPVKRYDSQGLPLPEYHEKVILGDGEFFVVSTYPNSFDSRYFGTIRREDIKWVARPLFVF
jgi:conjugative transfer signal peptidase TraF